MEQWDITCCKCGKFILTEQRGDDNEIRCIKGSYENGFYNDIKDEFFCNECWNLKEMNKNLYENNKICRHPTVYV